MRARIVILPDGKTTVVVEEGAFAEGAAAMLALLAALNARGVAFEAIGQPEQHRHAAEHAHAHVEAPHDC